MYISKIGIGYRYSAYNIGRYLVYIGYKEVIKKETKRFKTLKKLLQVLLQVLANN
ncbi:17368_t:CDS:2 [Acaulospora morrowiae]|uniref:17368_t:CDS:1 n=1 Tax=Acaulospora morrowiae TaxID=94023 RepID=A0A9N8YP69_9GLOM|nr:17368_t:CDS:2 [Acaulospora morrowiae]